MERLEAYDKLKYRYYVKFYKYVFIIVIQNVRKIFEYKINVLKMKLLWAWHDQF